jgi:protein SCO1
VGVCAAPQAFTAERTEPAPADLDGVGITAKLDAEIPLGLEFTDEDGTPVRLRDYFEKGRPVILTLNYYRCPMLCTLVLNGLVAGLRDVELEAGEDYQVVTVTIDPREKPELAKAKKASYLESFRRPFPANAWHFLTGGAEPIRMLAAAAGFGYRYVEADDQFAHPAAIYVLTPEGRISRVLTGVAFEPKTLRLALVEASSGKVGSAIDQFILYCYHYDAERGHYAPAAVKIMRLGGALTVLVLGSVLAAFWVREKRGRRTT